MRGGIIVKKTLQVLLVLIITFFTFSAVNPTVVTDSDFANQGISSINDEKPQVDNNTNNQDKNHRATTRENPDDRQNSDSIRTTINLIKTVLKDNLRPSRYRIDVPYPNRRYGYMKMMRWSRNGWHQPVRTVPLRHLKIQNRENGLQREIPAGCNVVGFV